MKKPTNDKTVNERWLSVIKELVSAKKQNLLHREEIANEHASLLTDIEEQTKTVDVLFSKLMDEDPHSDKFENVAAAACVSAHVLSNMQSRALKLAQANDECLNLDKAYKRLILRDLRPE